MFCWNHFVRTVVERPFLVWLWDTFFSPLYTWLQLERSLFPNWILRIFNNHKSLNNRNVVRKEKYQLVHWIIKGKNRSLFFWVNKKMDSFFFKVTNDLLLREEEFYFPFCRSIKTTMNFSLDGITLYIVSVTKSKLHRQPYLPAGLESLFRRPMTYLHLASPV